MRVPHREIGFTVFQPCQCLLREAQLSRSLSHVPLPSKLYTPCVPSLAASFSPALLLIYPILSHQPPSPSIPPRPTHHGCRRRSLCRPPSTAIPQETHPQGVVTGGHPRSESQPASAFTPTPKLTMSAAARSILRARRNRKDLRSLRHAFVCVPRPATAVLHTPSSPVPAARNFHCLRPPSDSPSRLRDFRRPLSPPEAEGSLPCCPGLIGSPSIYFCFYACLKSHLRRYLLQQILVHSRPRHVRPPGDQPDGAGDVQLSRVAAERRAESATVVRGQGAAGLQGRGPLPHLQPPIPCSLTHAVNNALR